MALDADDASVIAQWLTLHGGASTGADDTETIGTWLRSRWATFDITDEELTNLYLEYKGMTLSQWADQYELRGGGVSP